LGGGGQVEAVLRFEPVVWFETESDPVARS